MPTLQEIEDEIERRELIASIQSAPTATEQQPAGPVPTPQQGLAGLRDAMQAGAVRDREEEQLGLTNAAAQFTRGMLPEGWANMAGASVAAIPAKYLHGDERSLGEIRDEMLELEDIKEDKLDEIDPGLKTAGTVASVGSLAAAPARALGGALARTGSKALGSTKSGAQALGGRAGGAWEGAKAGAKLDAAGVLMGDLEADMTQTGAAAGAIAPEITKAITGAAKKGGRGKLLKALTEGLLDSPGGRKILALGVNKLAGGKTANAAWHALNPANQAKLKRIIEGLK